ncbi:hypothetical protein [Bacillus cereus]|uniref:hypothetical protein n=1 Tax=Bacillus cereus TaxID=1396 RepID=UPI0021132006|nr:hypothetical protein [Bacillus cereus]
MNMDCRTIAVAEHVNELNCLRCGGPTRPTAFKRTEKQGGHCKAKELTIQVNADTTGALKGIKEVTEAANECVVALEKLEKVMGRFTNKNELKDIKVGLVINGKVTAESILKNIKESDVLKERF